MRTRNDLFWAHCLLAIAQLNGPPSLAEAARVRLSECLSRQRYSWLYMLRGYANGRAAWVLAASRARTFTGSLPDESEARFQESEADFEKSLQLGLDAELTYALRMNRGVIRFHRNLLVEAQGDFEKAIAEDESRFNADAALAQVFRRQKERSRAIAQFDRAIELEPKMAALYRGRALARLDGLDIDRTEKERATSDLATSSHLEPPGLASASDHVARSFLLFDLDRPADVLSAADAAIAIAPNLASAHLMKVTALVALKKLDGAIESCDIALAGGLATPDLYQIRGRIRFDNKDYPGAIEDYSRALSLRPHDPWKLRRERGWAYLLANSPEAALPDFQAVIDRDKHDPDGLAGRAASRIRLGQYREAVADAQESIRRPGASDRHEYSAAHVLAQASKFASRDPLRPKDVATRDSLDYEKLAADLIAKVLRRKPADARAAFWNESVLRDPILSPVLRNRVIKQQLQAIALSSR